jgi:hypothetical protein
VWKLLSRSLLGCEYTEKAATRAGKKLADPRVAAGGSKSDIARAKELIEKHGLQRLLHTKR